MNPYLAPDLNSFMMASLSFWTMSPCMDDTVKLASLIFSVNQSTCTKGKQNVHKRFFTHKHMLSLHINDYISISCIPSIYMYLSLCVAEYDSLCDGQSIIEITKGIKLPLFSLNSHKELFDAFQCQLVTVIYKYVNVNQCFKNSTHQRLNVFKSQNLFYNSLNCKFILLQRAFLLTVL